MAQALDLSILAWSPLASGVLTGKYHGKAAAEGARLSRPEIKEFVPDELRTKRIVSVVKSVSEEIGGQHGPGGAGMVAIIVRRWSYRSSARAG